MSITYSKSALGAQEVGARKLNLAASLRNALILVDKSKAIEKLQRDAKLIGAPENFIEQLLTLGLIVANDKADNSVGNVAVAPSSDTRSNTVSRPTPSIPVSVPEAITEFDLRGAQRQLVKLIEKALGPGGERLAVTVESTSSEAAFVAEAAKVKAVLTSVRAATADEPFWATLKI